jgi:serine/threonine protein kinase/Flp pilus assembly protein TadD
MDNNNNQLSPASLKCPQCFGQVSEGDVYCRFCHWPLTDNLGDANQILDTTAVEATIVNTNPEQAIAQQQYTQSPQAVNETLTSADQQNRADTSFHLTGELAHFEVCEILGQGSMGAVYRATDQILQRTVALKVLSADKSYSSVNPNALLDEARMACKLNHPNIVTIYEVTKANDSHCIVMEWVDGQPLDELIPADGLDLLKALKYASQISDGLLCAHQNQIIHHDIKPQNIMLMASGQIKILDFGIAGLVQKKPDGKHGSSFSGTNITGTPSYMAPEQALGQSLDERADIFSFGIVLYLMLTGKRPFAGKTGSEVTKAIINGDGVALSQYLPDLPVRVLRLVDKMLATDKNARWQSTTQLTDEIHAIYGELSGEKNWWQRRNRLSKAAILLPFVLLLGWSSKEVLFPPTTDELIQRQLSDATTVAMLPFDNISGDPLLQLFSDGLAVTLGNDLAQAGRERGNSWVIPSTTISRMKDPTVQQLSDKYGVDLVLTGSVQHLGSTRSLALNLLDGKDGRQLKTAELSIDASQLFQGQSDIRKEALALLGWSLSPELLGKFNANKPQLDGAYKEYLQGRGYLYRYDISGNLNKAELAFNRAIAIDSDYQSAYVGLAVSRLRRYNKTLEQGWLEKMATTITGLATISPDHSLLNYLWGEWHSKKGDYQKSVDLFQSSITGDTRHIKSYFGLAKGYDKLGQTDKAEKIYQRAAKMAPNNVIGVITLGIFYFRHGENVKAIGQFKQLSLMAPNNSFAYSNMAAAFYSLGQIDQAIENNRFAIALNPTGRAYSNLATMLFYQKSYHDAVDAYQEALKFNANAFFIWGNLADAYRFAKINKSNEAYQKAADLALTALDLNPKDSQAMTSLAYYLANLAREDQALQYLDKIDLKHSGSEHFKAALAYDILGKMQQVLDHLSIAIDKHYSVDEIRDTPLLENVRQDERFERLLSK